MSEHVDGIASRATKCAADASWRQWRALASAGADTRSGALSIIDPEALVLLSLTVRRSERRLDDQLLWWAESGSSLMSVQRMRTLLADAPPRVIGELGAFAATAVKAGDARWKVLAPVGQEPIVARHGKGPRELQLTDPSTLMLRLRAGFGVGAKADLLTFLLGANATIEPAVRSTAELIAKGLSYSVASIRRATSDMALARMIEVSADRPVQYAVDAKSWSDVLKLRQPLVARSARSRDPVPKWRFWSHMFAFLGACIELGEDPSIADAPAVVQASHVRDIAERHRRSLGWNGIEWVDPRQFPGARYLDAFDTLLTQVVELVERES
jgi:hypothetical protein